MKTLQLEIMKALEDAKCLDPESENWSYHAASRIAAEVASQFREPSSPTVKESETAEQTALRIAENVKPPLTVQEQAFFIAGFIECDKYRKPLDR